MNAEFPIPSRDGRVAVNAAPAPVSVLLIDDDRDLCQLMADFFHRRDMAVTLAYDGRAGLAIALEAKHDLILLDVMLPVLDGFEVLRQLRRRSRVPIIMLTARTSQPDRVAGLDAGADDYLPKPFGPDELLARIRAVLRRTKASAVSQGEPISTGTLTLDPFTRTATLSAKPLELTAIEFDILEYLVRGAGRVVSRDELSSLLYQRPATPYERAIDVHISHLRKKIEPSGTVVIRTLRGMGYLLTTPRAETAP